MSTSNPFSHVDVRVADMHACLPFYTRLLPALGFEHQEHSDPWKVFVAPGELPGRPFVSLVEEPGHRPNDNRVAFWVARRQDVDDIGSLLQGMGTDISSGPRFCPEYSPTYYAVFFSDPSGNKLEVVHRTS